MTSFAMPVHDSTESSQSMMYANSDMPPKSLLSSFKTMYYSNPIFVKQGGKEYLALPWSVCADRDHTVYVADYGQDKLHVFSSINRAIAKGGPRPPFWTKGPGKWIILYP